MNVLTALATVSKLVPVVLSIMDTLESQFTEKGKGAQKMQALRSMVMSVQDVSTDISQKDYAGLIEKAISAATTINKLRGVFKS